MSSPGQLVLSSLAQGPIPTLQSNAITTSTIATSSINASTIATQGLALTSTSMNLGASAGQTKTNFSQGSYAASSWGTAQSGLNANKKIQMSATGQYQLDLTSPIAYLSSDSGITWSALGVENGLPTGGTWLNGAISATGQYIALADSIGGFIYVSNDFGATFNNTTPLSSAASLYAWLRFNGNTTDTQGNANGTVTGSVTYVTGVTPGSQAVNLANTAGGAATSGNYIRGPWANVPNFTVSGWFNPQTINGTFQVIYSSHSAAVEVFINNNNQIVGQFPTGNGSSFSTITTSFPAVVNTWYYFTLIYQTNGICYFYLNNTLIGTMINAGGLGSFTSSGFYALGIYDHFAGYNAYNGYIDDFKITNAAITYQPVPIIPPAVWFKFEGNTTNSGSNAITPTIGTAMSYVTGAVGNYAVRLGNPVSGTATQFIRAPLSLGTSFTLSGWFYMTSIPTTTNWVSIVTLGRSESDIFYIWYRSTTQNGTLYNFIVSFYNGSGVETLIGQASNVSPNAWYHFYVVYQQSGTCSVYLNNTLIGSIPGQALIYPITQFSIGTNAQTGINNNAFDGYIDDLRFYNTAVPFTPMIPANYNALALSGSGQYLLASNTLGQLIQSSDFGVTWANNAAGAGPQLTQTDLALSHSGQYAVAARRKVVTPNTPGPWSQVGSTAAYTISYNGITWISDASSNSGGSLGVYAFEDLAGSGLVWTSATNYSNSGTTYNNAFSTTVQTLTPSTTVNGEYIELRSSVPLVLSGFNFAGVGATQNMRTYYVVGSINGTTWYPIQYGSMTANFASGSNVRCNTVISTNYTGIQSLRGSDSTIGSVTTTAYPYSTGSYTHFRWIATTTWGATTFAIDELFPQFVANTISPQLTGLSANTWAQSGVNYTATSSSNWASLQPYGAFNYYIGDQGVYAWGSAGTYSATAPFSYTGGVTTTIQNGIGSVSGEWLQLQCSAPMVLQSYSYGCGGYLNMPKVYYIVGSNDGSTWFPLQFATTTTNPFTANFQGASNNILMNFTGTQSVQGPAQTGVVTTTAYSTTTNAYTYFRILANSVMGNGTLFELCEWYTNFATPTLTSNTTLSTWSANLPQIATSTNVADAVALSGSGQYLLQATKVQPYAWVPFDNSATDLMTNTALTVTGSPTYVTDRLGAANGAINLANATAGGSAGQYVRGTNTFGSSFTVSGWFNLQSLPTTNVAVIFGTCSGTQYSPVQVSYYPNIAGYTGLVFYSATQSLASVFFGYVPSVSTNTWYHFTVIYQSGVLYSYLNGVPIGTSTVQIYNPNDAFCIGAHANGGNAFNGYIDDVRIYNTALTTTQVSALFANQTSLQNNSLSSSYLPSTSFALPATLNPSSPVTATASSFNGQIMVATTSGLTNNVYYSTNAGSTWTSLTIPTGATESLQGAAISSDGSYITVISNTATYTLNENSTGFTLAVGNQAGQFNQGRNAVAIGNQAGVRNQTENSIVLNATGSAVNAAQSGFYVAPVAGFGSAAAPYVNVLGYGADQQVIQSGVRIYGSGTTSLGTTLHLSAEWSVSNNYGGVLKGYIIPGVVSGLVLGGATAAGALVPAMYCTDSGYVGIGTANPAARMHIYGTLYPNSIISSPNSSLELVVNTASPFNNIIRSNTRLDLEAPANYPRLSIDPNTGNVGIAITNPNSLLHINGTGSSTVWPLTIDTNSSSGYAIRFRWNGGGQSGYIDTGPGITNYVSSSDERLKDQIRDVNEIRHQIDHMRPRTFIFKNDPNAVTYTGFIAQEFRNYYPQYVCGNDQDEDNYFGMDYGKLTPFAIAGIKDLYTITDDFAIKYNALQNIVEAQQQRIQTLEAQQQAMAEQISILIGTQSQTSA